MGNHTRAPRWASNHGRLCVNVEIKSRSPQETDHFTHMIEKHKIKHKITPKNDLDILLSLRLLNRIEFVLNRLHWSDFHDFDIVRFVLSRRFQWDKKLIQFYLITLV